MSYRFPSSLCSLEFSSLEEKYDIFRYEDEGTCRSTQHNTRNTRSLIRTLKYVPDIVADGRSLYGERA